MNWVSSFQEPNHKLLKHHLEGSFFAWTWLEVHEVKDVLERWFFLLQGSTIGHEFLDFDMKFSSCEDLSSNFQKFFPEDFNFIIQDRVEDYLHHVGVEVPHLISLALFLLVFELWGRLDVMSWCHFVSLNENRLKVVGIIFFQNRLEVNFLRSVMLEVHRERFMIALGMIVRWLVQELIGLDAAIIGLKVRKGTFQGCLEVAFKVCVLVRAISCIN